MKASIAASRKRSVRSSPRLQSSTSGRGRNGACVCLDAGVDGAMDLGMAGRAFAAWIGCGACILHPADRVRRRGGDQVAALSVRNALSVRRNHRSEEHTSELQSLMRISYAVFCLKKKNLQKINNEKQSSTYRKRTNK